VDGRLPGEDQVRPPAGPGILGPAMPITVIRATQRNLSRRESVGEAVIRMTPIGSAQLRHA